MTNFTITPELIVPIKAALGYINKHCTYTQVWYINTNNYTIQKLTVEANPPIDEMINVPTSLQIGDLAKTFCNAGHPHEISMFCTYMTQVGYWYPTANLYEIMLIALANLIKHIQDYVEEHEDETHPLIPEDPFE
jgi:hypothetical protein